MRHFPKQRYPYNEKIKDDYAWAKKVIDILLTEEFPNPAVVNYQDTEYYRKLSNYQLFNNIINQKDFERDCNRFGISVGQFTDEIQPYNKTYNKIQVLLQDEMNRPFRYKAILTNSDGVRTKLQYRDMLLKEYVYSRIQQAINSLGVYPKELVSNNEVMDPAQINKYMNNTYLESREILANRIIQYLIKKLSIRDKKNDGFKHGLISGEEVVWVGDIHGKPTIIPVNSLGFFYHKSGETKFIQKGLYAGYRTYMSSGDVLDTYGPYLKEEEIEMIDTRASGGLLVNAHEPGAAMDYHLDEADNMLFSASSYNSLEGSYSSPHIQDWLVQHVEWRSQQKIGFITFINQYGDEQIDLVDEFYEPPKAAKKVSVTKEYGRKQTLYVWKDSEGIEYSYEEGWIPQIWSGVRIGRSIYCMIGPKKEQFRSVDDPFDVKLGYHGVVYSSMNAAPVSLMDRMKPFQYLYFIIMHKLKKLIAHDRGKSFHFDTTMVDPKIGWEKTIYYLEEMDIDFFNPLQNAEKPGGYNRAKIQGSTDRSNMQHILNYVNLLAAIDQQIAEVSGVSRQREGQAAADEAVTNAQSNIQMSALITGVYFNTHDKLWEEVLTSLLQVARDCWKNRSFVKQFVLDDLSLSTLEIDQDISEADLGVFVIDSSKEQATFDTIRNNVLALLQNDKMNYSTFIKTLKTDSLEELESYVIEAENRFAEMQKQNMEAQMNQEAQLQKAQQDFELLKLDKEIEGKVLVEEIKAIASSQDSDVDNNGIPDPLEVEKFKADLALKNRKLDLEERKLNQDKEQKEKDRAAKSK